MESGDKSHDDLKDIMRSNEIPLKRIVDDLLKERERPLSWLARQMDKTFDGLKLSLIKGSIKYTDLVRMAEVLGVDVCWFFAKR
ncbi:MAG: hypothetical protein V4594_21015 [Bacteroidota bacterium]